MKAVGPEIGVVPVGMRKIERDFEVSPVGCGAEFLHDVAHDLIPRAVEDALRERGVEAIDTPDVRDVNVEEGQPLTFTASFDTVPLPRIVPAVNPSRIFHDECAY